MILLFTILFNLLEAIYEGLYDRGKKVASGIIELIFKSGVVTVCLLWFSGYRFLLYHWPPIPLWKVFLGFVFVRFLLFDITWNLARGVSWNYYGTVKWYDRTMAKLGEYGYMLKAICGLIGIIFLLGIE
jgi:hypothetical protein